MSDSFNESNNNKSYLKKGKKEDINTMLRHETSVILSNDLKADDATIVPNQTIINNDCYPNKDAVSDAQWLKEYMTKLLASSSPMILKYHKSEIENVNLIITFILSLIKWVSLITIALVAIFVVFEKNAGAIISSVTGGIIDTLLGILTHLFNSTLKSKKSYFDAENDSSRFNKMLLLIQTISDQHVKDSVIGDILRKYFDINNDKR